GARERAAPTIPARNARESEPLSGSNANCELRANIYLLAYASKSLRMVRLGRRVVRVTAVRQSSECRQSPVWRAARFLGRQWSSCASAPGSHVQRRGSDDA